MDQKDQIKQEVKEECGRLYSDFAWLSEEKAKSATKKRDLLLKRLSNYVTYSFKRNKIHIGRLSPGCLTCGQGYWSCLFINHLCTAKCFFCPQDRRINTERAPSTDGVVFDNPDDYVMFLRKFNFKGVGISGGEPLLVFDKLLAYIRKIKKAFGKSIYVWIYTNGDVVTGDKLRELNKYKLDEIRFNIAARNYDLRQVELATRFIETVTVEVPAIPEDYKRMRGCLLKMERMGVHHLNLHQLIGSSFSYKNLIRRRYTFLHNFWPAILESQLTQLRIMKYALDNKIKLPINCCTYAFQERLQPRGIMRWRSPLVKENFEELTESNYIRRLSIQNTPENIERVSKILKENKQLNNLWALDDKKTQVFIHSSFLKYIDFDEYNLTIVYFEPRIYKGAYKGCREFSLNSKKKIFLKKVPLTQMRLDGRTKVNIFKKIFIDKIDQRKVFGEFQKNHKVTFQAFKDFVLVFKEWEHIESDFPEIY
jgi:pyruvate formate-lyase activating enzyme-like uncharacterized protein